MRTRLERLLENIEPIPDRIDRQVDQAINTFAAPSAVISDWNEHEAVLADFYCHVECVILGIPLRCGDVTFYGPRCRGLLRRAYGESVAQTAFELVRTGVDGGVSGMMRRIGSLYGSDYAENLIRMTVEAYWSHRSSNELIRDGQEYIRLYRHIIPREIAEGSGGRILGNFRKTLNQHPFVVRGIRRSTNR